MARGYCRGRDEGTAIWMLDTLMHVKAGAEDTGGAFTLIEQLAPPVSVRPCTCTGPRMRASTSSRVR